MEGYLLVSQRILLVPHHSDKYRNLFKPVKGKQQYDKML